MIIADEMKVYLDKINIEPLKEFVEKSITEYGSAAKLKKANKVADVVWQKFVSNGYITHNAQQQFVDITIAACLLHNLFYNENDITTILKHRVKLVENKQDLDERILSIVFELIEGQLGENHPIQKLKPAPNSPGSTLSDAIWFVNSYKASV